jgi:hypothetical protein
MDLAEKVEPQSKLAHLATNALPPLHSTGTARPPARCRARHRPVWTPACWFAGLIRKRPYFQFLLIYIWNSLFEGQIMKNIITVLLLAVTSFAAMGQPLDRASIAQKQRQQANAGAIEAKKAYTKGGIYELAQSSSDCMDGVKTGRASPYKCMGIEAAGLALKEKTPANSSTQAGLDWFDSEKITNRVYAYCFMFLGIRSEMACAQTFATAKMASDSVVAGIPPFNKDGIGVPAPETPAQTEKRIADQRIGETRGSANVMAVAYRQSEIEGITAVIQNCDMRTQGDDKQICNYMDAAGLYIDDLHSYNKKTQGSPFFERQLVRQRMLNRLKSNNQSDEQALKNVQKTLRDMDFLTPDALRANP